MRTLLLINKKSGAASRMGAEKCLEIVQGHFGADNVDYILCDGDPGTLVEKAAAAAKDPDIDKVILIAGDGTAAAVAGVLSGTDTAFAPLPGGTMNALSRDLGYSADLETAVEEAHSGIPCQIDIAFVNGSPFLNNVVFGTYSLAAEAREAVRDAEGIAETASAAAGFVNAVAQSDPIRYSVATDDETVLVETNTLMVANNAYTGAEQMRPVRERIDSGRMSVYIPDARNSLDFVSVLFDTLAGRLSGSEKMEIKEALRCSVRSAGGTLNMSVDGEAMEIAGPAQFVMHPKALTVIAPQRAR